MIDPILIEKWLIAKLLSDSDLRSTIGERIFPVRIPQRDPNQASFVDSATYRLAGQTRYQAVDGFTGEAIATYQLRFWSTSFTQARRLAAFATNVLDSNRDDPEEVTVENDGFVIQRTSVLDLADDEQAPFLADDIAIYAAILTVEIAYVTEELLIDR